MSASYPILTYAAAAQIDPTGGRNWLKSPTECAYCRSVLSNEVEPNEIEPKSGSSLFRVATCNRCGWWFSIEDADDCNAGHASVCCGILKEFDLSSADVPLQVLTNELPKRLDALNSVHPNRMEDYVAEVLKGVHDCEVRQLGYTRDGGIDLLILESDRPIAVQVKRRASPQKNRSCELCTRVSGSCASAKAY